MPRWKNVLQTSDEVYRLKRSAVLREATRIIGRNGYHNTSLDDIAEALQVAKGTLYNYVKDKQEILFECHQMALDIGDQAFAFAELHGTSGYAKLRLMLRAYLTWMNGAMGGGGVASEVTALRPQDRKAVIKRRDQVEARLVEYLKVGFEDGTVRKVDPKLAVFTIMGAVNAVQSWYSAKGPMTLEEIAAGMVDMLMHGIDTAADSGYVDIPVPAYGSIEDAAPDARMPSSAKAAAAPRKVRAVRKTTKKVTLQPGHPN